MDPTRSAVQRVLDRDPAEPDTGRASILNVDDDDASRQFKSRVLESAGFVATEARTGMEALARVSADPPDLVLLDVHMPGLDGFEVCERLKKDPRTQSIPVLHVSAACITDQDWTRGLESGADSYLIAPVSPDVMLATIRTLLKRATTEKALRAEQARVMDALRESERRYRDLVLHAPYGIYAVTRDGRILSANRALAQILEYPSPDDLTSMNAEEFYQDPTDRQRMVGLWLQQRRIGDSEARWRTRNGRALVVRLTGRTLAGGAPSDEQSFEVFVEDITEQRRWEAERRHAQKMEAIGSLAAGIAHDFNNLLTAILGYTELMLEQIDADKPIYEDLQKVRDAGRSAAALTKQLLAFGRKQTLRLEAVDVSEVVRVTDQWVRRVIGEGIEVVVDTEGPVPAIRADRVQLEQIVLNLVVNARDAMLDGGTLTIQTRYVEIEEPLSVPGPVVIPPGSYVRVTVSDTGCGMDAATRDRIFEPFFTTKELGRGTGLGLATVYGIVKQLEGYIVVSSEVGHGSTFSAYFPIIAGPSVAPAPIPAERREVPLGRERVLLVEDEASVRALARNVLARHGYHVLEAACPADALALLDQQVAPLDLIVTDVVMPGMTGPALVAQLRAEAPLTAVYMSGYAGPEVMSALAQQDSVFLPKPFKPLDLLTAVRRALDRA